MTKQITIIGKRWFQRTYGNTYHTAEIIINGAHVHTTEREYGYDDQYIETALSWLEKQKKIEPRKRHTSTNIGEALWQYTKRTDIAFTTRALDVPRQKDL